MSETIGLSLPPLAPWRSPQSPLWDAGGGYPGNLRPIVASRRDIYFGGDGQIVGTVEEDSPSRPLRRRVQLFNANTSLLVAQTWSDAATGDYAFQNIHRRNGDTYFVVSFDHAGRYKAVIADNLEPEAMP